MPIGTPMATRRRLAGSPRQLPRSPAGAAEGTGRDASGFTVIEMMVSLLVLSVGILGVISTFVVATESSGYARALTQADDFAGQWMETMGSVTYDSLGMAAAVTGSWTDPGDGQSYTYVSGGAIPASGTTSYNGITFSGQFAVVKPASALPQGEYKRCVVIVTWTDRSGPHTVREDQTRYSPV
jgi:prepilin-type N-terminal cleavage/methylation domain-containing protein